MIGVLLTLYGSITSVRQGSRQALFFLVAYLPQLLAVVLIVAQIRVLDGSVWVNVFFLASYAFSSIVLSLGMADQVLGYRKQRDDAIHESQHDPLTGAFNRRAANQALARAIQRLDTGRESLAVCFFDLDFFKRVNDRFGHALGDQALRLLVTQAQLELRSSDFLARLGGEEFIAVLPGAYLRDGLNIAERIRARIERNGKIIAALEVNLTVSVGVIASNAKLNSAEALLDAADQALYLAKSRGRNRVETIDLVSLAHHQKDTPA
jgi:diguanylate cyclase (GGDEF)-like protein